MMQRSFLSHPNDGQQFAAMFREYMKWNKYFDFLKYFSKPRYDMSVNPTYLESIVNKRSAENEPIDSGLEKSSLEKSKKSEVSSRAKMNNAARKRNVYLDSVSGDIYCICSSNEAGVSSITSKQNVIFKH
ncbi:hypothetical protein RF11_10965 [Thelohanellus kitauei]|uniref:Uncharacterized protein n=1 Tax=Thelohanellus kitauei TaxID=669202 RepID=A0A0C2MGC0_THEKT|nr:hypothetical protein RF11_10965 [Thelohanellus kitauei]